MWGPCMQHIWMYSSYLYARELGHQKMQSAIRKVSISLLGQSLPSLHFLCFLAVLWLC